MKSRIPWNKGIPCSEKTKEKISKAKMNLSEETRRRISLNHADVSGENNPNWGKICSEETRAKIGKGNKGKKRTPDVLAKLSKMRKGRKKSEAFCKKMRDIMKGEANPMRGKKHTEEVKRRISETLRGKNGPNWKGGVTILYHSIQSSVTYKLWREAVFTRDNFCCQVCGDNKGRNLNAHHIKPFVEIIKQCNITSLGQAIRTEELWDINNGITICENCHGIRHSRMRKVELMDQPWVTFRCKLKPVVYNLLEDELERIRLLADIDPNDKLSQEVRDGFCLEYIVALSSQTPDESVI